MFNIADEARLQTTAGASLLTNSTLVRWSIPKARFEAVMRKQFEGHSTKSLDPHFGRVMRWILFSAGAEFFVKGLCLQHGIEIRTAVPKRVPNYPTYPIDDWVRLVQHDRFAAGELETIYFSNFSDLFRNRPKDSHIARLAAAASSDPHERARITTAIMLLTETIRNRDAHANVPNVRDSHFELVKDLCNRLPGLTCTGAPILA